MSSKANRVVGIHVLSDPPKGQAVRRLFELYAHNWQVVKQHPNLRVEPNIDDVFLCPLCFKYFERKVLDYENVLTREHVPPQSLGGQDRDCTLTCADCNHTAGSRLDRQLGLKLQTDELLSG